MKKTLFITMLAVALLGGGSAFADYIPTSIEGCEYKQDDNYYGSYSVIYDATEGEVFISSSSTGEDKCKARVCGGYALKMGSVGGGGAFGNAVFMDGGQVKDIYGGYSEGYRASDNIVIMSGGRAQNLYGGYGDSGASSNSIFLVGSGVTVYLPGVLGNSTSFTGDTISIDGFVTGGAARLHHECPNNAITIYGSNIKAGGLSAFDFLNFHLLADQLASTAPMVTITEAGGFSLTEGLTLSFYAEEEMEWEPGDSVTLVEAQNCMSIAPEVLAKEYNIYQNGDPEKILATAKLVLEDSQNSTQFLKLTFQGVPEPATGTLGLLALTALAARRKR